MNEVWNTKMHLLITIHAHYICVLLTCLWIGITNGTTFALCFRVGGGIMTLGGVDQKLHTNKIEYATMKKSNSWFQVSEK